MKILPKMGLEPTTSYLLDWRSRRIYIVSYYIVLAMRNEYLMVSSKRFGNCIIVLHDNAWSNHLSDLFPDQVVYRLSSYSSPIIVDNPSVSMAKWVRALT